MKTSPSTFGIFIKERRKNLGMSITDLSTLSQISEDHLCMIESGTFKQGVTDQVIKLLASALKIPPTQLLIAIGYLDGKWASSDYNRQIAFQMTMLKVENAWLRHELQLAKNVSVV
ncbi:helix-turn-helix domain-containing protein [Paenibacillus glucanolyticus]|jgi:transcriptional regulator with XRE-family HTH domain|uniref:helix-turn-helix domain-containing protein n=1 Tax=Paenibacillus glucanolyticus TaxID=59843 RepID=UPI001884325B|nr:helix-turn-helix transcriptional regulator [Paenibacillus glucanolyticus]MCA4755536.1 helix-turn-helix transcriptional regulator [Mycolicibacterium fortuitum]